WDHYADQHPAASIYHLTPWRQVIQQCFGHLSYYYYAHNADGRMIGILPLVRLRSRLFGDFMVSMPYFNYGGAIADHPAIEEALIQYANKQASALKLDHIEYRDDISRPDTPERTNKVNMILALPADEASLWQSFSPKLRSQIRRPQRENTRTQQGGMELLDDFYTVFARNMRDLGTPVYSKDFFATILRTFPDQASLLTVYLGGRAVAGAFLIGYKQRLEIPWASTVRNANALSVTMLMYWEVLRFAIRNKYTSFDFGRSSVDSGTYKFKKQWGAQPRQLYWHYWLDGREMPSLNPNNPKYRLMINIWKKLPIWVTRMIGPPIVKNLP
ncbi:MAG: FemAB family PEP-CTERM system-associated protein, partial [Gammaproteobacteria bacterium]